MDGCADRVIAHLQDATMFRFTLVSLAFLCPFALAAQQAVTFDAYIRAETDG
jgi:hypothetical protein